MKRPFLMAVVVLAGALTSGCVTSPSSSRDSAPYRGIGYASVSVQPGKTLAQRQLMAIRASRMAAMRELAEKIHGLNMDSNTTLTEGVIQNDTLRATLSVVVRGARVVSINPSRGNVYETILEIDAAEGDELRRNVRPILYR